jgi:WhiB family transcriptional regulator, redox-sensing transcriptional regulator
VAAPAFDSWNEYVELRTLMQGEEELVTLADLFRSLPGWQRDGLCHEYPLATFYPERGQTAEEARGICARCPVAFECLSYALETFSDFEDCGIWGGTSPKERKAMRRSQREAKAA